MSWKERIASGGATWDAVVEWARERIANHEKVCRSRMAPEPDIRAAQAAIEELERLCDLPRKLKMEAQAKK